MKMKEPILEAVVEELEKENTFTFSEISVPDETISATTEENESIKQNGHLNPVMERVENENGIDFETINAFPESEHQESGKTDSKNEKVFENTIMPENHNTDKECANGLQNYPVTVKSIVEDSSGSGQSTLRLANSSSAFAHTSDDSTRTSDQNIESQNNEFSIQVSEIENGVSIHRNYHDDDERSKTVVELTRENLKHHTKTMKNDSNKYHLLSQEHLTDKVKSSVTVTTILPTSDASTLPDKAENNAGDTTITCTISDATILPKSDSTILPDKAKNNAEDTTVTISVSDASILSKVDTAILPDKAENNAKDTTITSSFSDGTLLPKSDTTVLPDNAENNRCAITVAGSISDVTVLHKGDASVPPSTPKNFTDENNRKGFASDTSALPEGDASVFPDHAENSNGYTDIKGYTSDATVVSKSASIQPDSAEDNVDEKISKDSLGSTISKKQTIDDKETVYKFVNDVNHNTDEAIKVSPTESSQLHRQAENKGSRHSNKKHKKKKKHNDLENVETLINQDEKANVKRKRRNKTKKSALCNETSTSQGSSGNNEYSLIKNGFDEGNTSQNNDNNERSSISREDGSVNGQLVDQWTGIGVKQGVELGHKRLLKREKQHKFQRKLPVYDANNTSTRMILLNNKYGKNSRLWTSEECHLNRGKLINPLRHQKEPSFYLSGNFHSRCSTSEETIRPCFTTGLTKFDFSNRPQSDKIGDRLYEAKISVNPNRHRSCQCTLPPITRPLNFSPLTHQERSNRYVFAWERLYAEPQLRPVSSVRPYSSISGKKAGLHVKVPNAFVAPLKKETAL